jgi:hypothetical protein
MRAADASWVRIDINWIYLQDSESTPVSSWHWGRYDPVINDARPSNARKMNVLVILHTVPGWANSNRGVYAPANNLALFKNYCYQVAKRYLPLGVTHYQICNEVNLPHPGCFDNAAGPGPNGGSYYSSYVVPGYDGVAQAAWDLGRLPFNIVLGSLAPVNWVPTPQKAPPHNFLVQVYDAAGGNNAGNQKWRWGAVAYHPYVDIGDLGASGFPSTHTNFKDIPNQLYADMSWYQDGAKKLWATEFGAPTSAAGSITEQRQAAWVDDTINKWYSNSYAGPFFWYSLRDRAPYGSTDREDYFGVLRFDRSKKYNSTQGAYARLKARFRF